MIAMSSLAAGELQYVTPLPPLRTGIAGYSHDLLRAVDGGWNIRVVPEPGSDLPCWSTFDVARRARTGDPAIVHVGNSGFHGRAMALATTSSSMLVLHDTVLHHGRLPQLIRARGGRDYLDLMHRLYGDEGRRAARAILSAGRDVDVSAYPLFEDLVERSSTTIVHSEFARRQVLARLPDAPVRRVPMGIPLPARVPREMAREWLDVPQSAFVVASITHVNPNKRLHVVFRALRRVKDRLPEILLVVAGSVSPTIDLQRLARVYGVERHVRLAGYVSDAEARLVARAADVCVNLRYPSAGETSASLLRLLGAERPVIVTDDAATDQYPRTAVLPVPVDRYEDEMVAELLLMLASDGKLRGEVGAAARRFIEEHHTMRAMIDGYREAVLDVFGIALPAAGPDSMHEPMPEVAVRHEDITTRRPFSSLDARVADAAVRGGVASHGDTMVRVARAMTRLGLHRLSAGDDQTGGGAE